MSCPDWQRLTRHRYAAAGEPPAGWGAALEHLDRCGSCRRRALEADPTLLFRRAAESGCRAGELAEIRASVRALRRGRRVESARRRLRRRYGSAAAAVLVLAASVLVLTVGGGAPAPEPALEPPPAMRFGDLVVPALDLAAPPLIEALDRPDARVYQLPQEDLSLVMIVDESLDV